jgi:hypothetical protein
MNNTKKKDKIIFDEEVNNFITGSINEQNTKLKSKEK